MTRRNQKGYSDEIRSSEEYGRGVATLAGYVNHQQEPKQIVRFDARDHVFLALVPASYEDLTTLFTAFPLSRTYRNREWRLYPTTMVLQVLEDLFPAVDINVVSGTGAKVCEHLNFVIDSLRERANWLRTRHYSYTKNASPLSLWRVHSQQRQEDVAGKLGISRAYYSLLESGANRNFSPTLLAALRLLISEENYTAHIEWTQYKRKQRLIQPAQPDQPDQTAAEATEESDPQSPPLSSQPV